jgi:hypothetical protein
VLAWCGVLCGVEVWCDVLCCVMLCYVMFIGMSKRVVDVLV